MTTITLEEALCIPTTTKPEISPIKPQITPHPPTKIDIIMALMEEADRLKAIREEVVTGQRQADNILKAEMYITQLGLSAYKIILDGLKENAKIELTQNNITQIKHVVKFVKPTRTPTEPDADT